MDFLVADLYLRAYNAENNQIAQSFYQLDVVKKIN